MLKLQPQGEGIRRWSLWERVRSGGINACIRREREKTCHVRTQQEGRHLQAQKRLNWLTPWPWNSQTPERWENTFRLFKAPGYGSLFWKPGKTKTDSPPLLRSEVTLPLPLAYRLRADLFNLCQHGMWKISPHFLFILIFYYSWCWLLVG